MRNPIGAYLRCDSIYDLLSQV